MDSYNEHKKIPSKIRNYAILHNKIVFIEQNHYLTFMFAKLSDQYSEGWHNEKENFSAYVNRLMENDIRNLQEKGKFLWKKAHLSSEPEPSPCLDTIKRLSSPDYDPPTDIVGILNDLKNLYAYWVNCFPDKAYSGTSPLGVCEEGLDLALAKLISMAKTWQNIASFYGHQHLSRTSFSSATKREKANIRKQIVLAIYQYGEKIPHGTRFSDVIKIIQGQFEKSKENENVPWGKVPGHMKVPGRDNMKKWLEEEGIFKRDFEQKGRYWFKGM